MALKESGLPDFRLYHKTSHQNSVVLAQKQKYISTEQEKGPKNKLMNLWSPNL